MLVITSPSIIKTFRSLTHLDERITCSQKIVGFHGSLTAHLHPFSGTTTRSLINLPKTVTWVKLDESPVPVVINSEAVLREHQFRTLPRFSGGSHFQPFAPSAGYGSSGWQPRVVPERPSHKLIGLSAHRDSSANFKRLERLDTSQRQRQ